MVDVERVCCMCGDVGFPDKIFRCINCHHRFQHSYCSNYYSDSSSEAAEVCDWCQADMVRTTKPAAAGGGGGSSSKTKLSSKAAAAGEGQKMQKQLRLHEEGGGSDQKVLKSSSSTGGGAPSPKTSTRRYKLLKDVMC